MISANGDVLVVDIDEDITEKAEVEAEAEAEAEAIITDDLINNKMVENYIYDKENYSWAKLIFTVNIIVFSYISSYSCYPNRFLTFWNFVFCLCFGNF